MLVACVASHGAGCADWPNAESACVADDDCAGCGRCTNGRCVFDPDNRPKSCVTEETEPCNGRDDDNNGVLDDPESCWAPVFAFTSDGGRCFGLSPLGPPSTCAGYRAVAAEPAFRLMAHPTAGAVRVRQCSHDSQHVIVRELPATSSGETVAAWEALGYDCSLSLGYAFDQAPELVARPPHGRPCALVRRGQAGAGGDPVRWRLTLGAEVSAQACDPTATLWVFGEGEACAAAPDESCVMSLCPLQPSGRVVARELADEIVAAPNSMIRQSWTLLNDGPLDWGPDWRVAYVAGKFSYSGSHALGRRVARGETYVHEVELGAPRTGLDLREEWMIVSNEGHAFAPMRLTVDVSASHAAHLVAMTPTHLSDYPPGFDLVATVTLSNVGSRAWSSDFRLRPASRTLATIVDVAIGRAVDVGESVTISVPLRTPNDPGDREELLVLVDADGDPVPIDGQAGVALALRVIGASAAFVVAESHPQGTDLPPGVFFLKYFRLENRGTTTWTQSWIARQSIWQGLALVGLVRLPRDVPPGATFDLAIPMRVPDGSLGEDVDDGWNLYDDNDWVVPIIRRDALAGTRMRNERGAWLWTTVGATKPCLPRE